MTWLRDRRNQILVGGCVGATLGALFDHFAGIEQDLVPVIVGFALGQVVAVLVGRAFQPKKSLKRTEQSLRD
jgi:hypothetical protein